MKVHISLVGAELAPVYAGIKYTDPDEIFLICSETTMSKTQQRLQPFLSGKKIHIKVFDATDLIKIAESLESLSKLINKDAELSVNLVGGTKHWTISFYDYFSGRENTSFLLGNQANLIWDFLKRKCEKITIPMEMQLKLQGQMPDEYFEFDKYTQEDDIVVTKAEQIWRNPKYRNAFTALTTDVKGKVTPQGFSYKSNGQNFAVFQTPDGNRVEFNSPHAVRLVENTAWFEYKVAKLLSKWGGSKDIWCNCVYRYSHTKKEKPGKSQDLNEIDIITYNGTKLLFIECKTAIYHSTDIDKFRTAVRNYGGLASKPIFITWFDPTADKRKKLKLNNIPYFALSNLDDDAELYKKLEGIMDVNNSQ